MFLIEVSLINRILFHSLYVKHLTGFTYLLVLTEPENILVKVLCSWARQNTEEATLGSYYILDYLIQIQANYSGKIRFWTVLGMRADYIVILVKFHRKNCESPDFNWYLEGPFFSSFWISGRLTGILWPIGSSLTGST